MLPPEGGRATSGLAPKLETHKHESAAAVAPGDGSYSPAQESEPEQHDSPLTAPAQRRGRIFSWESISSKKSKVYPTLTTIYCACLPRRNARKLPTKVASHPASGGINPPFIPRVFPLQRAGEMPDKCWQVTVEESWPSACAARAGAAPPDIRGMRDKIRQAGRSTTIYCRHNLILTNILISDKVRCACEFCEYNRDPPRRQAPLQVTQCLL
jgi:hypothetical protein